MGGGEDGEGAEGEVAGLLGEGSVADVCVGAGVEEVTGVEGKAHPSIEAPRRRGVEQDDGCRRGARQPRKAVFGTEGDVHAVVEGEGGGEGLGEAEGGVASAER